MALAFQTTISLVSPQSDLGSSPGPLLIYLHPQWGAPQSHRFVICEMRMSTHWWGLGGLCGRG